MSPEEKDQKIERLEQENQAVFQNLSQHQYSMEQELEQLQLIPLLSLSEYHE
ncbi:hypothetical protein WJM97_18385 [Okeanomitos corallinicola TIOX110]|uniref:Uncharacterized protein n=1 Tax=Okeanomitos corallinicola TIOX110 TaxID=3133117 RepID=A0ABZ2UV72_9CYAN